MHAQVTLHLTGKMFIVMIALLLRLHSSFICLMFALFNTVTVHGGIPTVGFSFQHPYQRQVLDSPVSLHIFTAGR